METNLQSNGHTEPALVHVATTVQSSSLSRFRTIDNVGVEVRHRDRTFGTPRVTNRDRILSSAQALLQ